MHNQWDCYQCQQFIKEIHAQHIRCVGNSKCYPIRHRIKQEEHSLMLFPFHIFKGIQHGQRPQNRYQHRKYHGHSIYAKRNRKPLHKMNYFQCPLRAIPGQKKNQQRCHHHDTFQINFHDFLIWKRNHFYQDSSNDWQ